MPVLDVVDRILARLLDGQREIEGHRRIGTGHDEKEARGVDADFVDDLVEGQHLARALTR